MGQGLAQSGQVISPITVYGPRDRVSLYREDMKGSMPYGYVVGVLEKR